MAISDALYVVEDWISEHYFTSDDPSKTFGARTKALMAEWSSTAADDPDWRSPRERFTSDRTGLVNRLLELQADAAALPAAVHSSERRALLGARSVALADEIRTILGFADGQVTAGSPGRWDVTVTGPLRRYATRGVDEAPFAMLDALAATDVQEILAKQAGRLPADVVLHEGTEDEQRLSTVPQVLSALAIAKDAPEFMLVLAGRFAVLTSAQLWPQGRYLVADIQTIAERNDLKRGGEVERMLAAISADSLAPDANSQIWWTATVKESIDNAVGVSEDLRDGVRESIEIIANEVIRRREARGLPPLPQDQAQPLALQSLRYLYRILFLLYAEASPEMGVLPVGAPEYQAGYSVDRLRDLTQREVPLDSADGTYLYSSLQVLFDLINTGHRPQDAQAEGPAEHGSGALVFENLDADLFRPDRTALIDEVQLGNAALQAVLENLLLSRVKKGRSRGFISYVALGINQLGAVYESLMSYTGSFADQTLVEVAKGGDPKGGSWVVPEDVIDDSMQQHLVMVEDETGRRVPRTYRHGEFVFRLSGRARQQSASYYSPEVITAFTVSQGLAELLDPVVTDESSLPEGAEVFDDEDFDHEPIRRRRTTAAEILRMSICEPALGSGAFAIEAVRQLAAEYLARRQDELDKRIDPEAFAQELQRVKAYIALHNVYGVDLNPTAVELAEVSLWLDTMAPGLKAPWFGLRLRPGNSLIGARHAVYSAETLGQTRLKSVIETAPQNLPITTVHEPAGPDGTRESTAGSVFHFLLPGEGWLAAAEDAEIKKLASDEAKALRDHAKGWAGKLLKSELTQLQKLSQRVEELWGLALRRIRAAEEHSRRAIPVWGTETSEGGEVTRGQIEEALADANSAYQRLRLVMDAWCALWFWPVKIDDVISPPTFPQWLETVQKILGTSLEVVKHTGRGKGPGEGQLTLGSAEAWEELDAVELVFNLGGAANTEKLIEQTPWLRRCVEIAREQRFFHWELDFAAPFDRGGFDLQVGNPPWVQPKLVLSRILADFDPWWSLTDKRSPQEESRRKKLLLGRVDTMGTTLKEVQLVSSTAAFVGSPSMYAELSGLQSDLYRNFMVQVWRSTAEGGASSLVHPPAYLNDARGHALRGKAYIRLRRHWRFLNKLRLFREIKDEIWYSINVYGPPRGIDFKYATGLFHPSVVEGSLRHDRSGPEPGFKDPAGDWNLSPHKGRIQRVAASHVEMWHELMEQADPSVAKLTSRMVSSVNRGSGAVLEALFDHVKAGMLEPRHSAGWPETPSRNDGLIESNWGRPASWNGAIIQGAATHVANPLYAEINPTMKNFQDYSGIDLEILESNYVPVTEYSISSAILRSRAADTETPRAFNLDAAVDRIYGKWPLGSEGASVRFAPVRKYDRVFWRKMAAPNGERTFIPAIFPPGAIHLDGMVSFGFPDGSAREVANFCASGSSLITDFFIRSTSGANIRDQEARRIPVIPPGHPLEGSAALRIARMNALTEAFSSFWSDLYRPEFSLDAWTGGLFRPNRPALGDVGPGWSMASPLRIDEDRRQALVEIDAIMAIVTGISIDDLVTIYRTQFGVLNDYDRGEGKKAYIFDVNGRQIPSSVRTAWNKAGRPETGLPLEERTATRPSATGTGRTIVYEQPFRILDREADMRQAYAEFTRRMEENQS